MSEEEDSFERHPDYQPEPGVYVEDDDGDDDESAPEPAEGDDAEDAG